MANKPKDFQQEIKLGLSLIVLVLVVLNFAAHYTLYRINNSIKSQVEDELLEAAVVIADNVQKYGYESIPLLTVSEIKENYSLDKISFVPLDYNRVLAIHNGGPLDSALLDIDPDLKADILEPALENKPIYLHHRGDLINTVIYPIEYAGSDYLIGASKINATLSSIENAGKILFYVGLLGILIIIYASRKFLHLVTYPVKSLKEKAEQSGRLVKMDHDDIDQLIKSYENIISDLRNNEKELVRLNDLTSRRAEDLELYNNYILKSIDTGIITLDNASVISTINRAAQEILGLSDKDTAERSCRHLFAKHPELIELIDAFINNEDEPHRQSVEFRRGDGSVRIVSVSLSRLIDSKGQGIGTSIILNDQTEFIQLREELDLKKHMAALGEMSGGLAHQLRNSIGAMLGFSKLIKKKLPQNDLAGQNANFLLKEAIEAERLVARFLDFARPLEIESTEFNILGLLKDMAVSCSEKYPGVRFEFHSDSGDKITIEGDSLLLKQAIGNVVDNACKAFRGSEGIIKIELDEAGPVLNIYITDNGPGIPEEYHDKVFAPFFSGSPSGSGLGLPLSRKIISLHQGSIDFESAPDRGTRFRITIPGLKSTRTDKVTAAKCDFNS